VNLTLTERRTVVRALPRAVAAELADRFPHAVEVTPTFDRRRYTLVAKGYVGFVTAGGWTIEFRPKWSWERVRCLFLPPLAPGGEGLGVRGALLDLFARRLAELMLARADAGLLHDYVEAESTNSHIRGRIDLPKQMRSGWRQPGLFDQIVDEFTPDVIWNQIPKAAAVRLLGVPGLSETTRDALSRAVAAFAGVGDTPVSEDERGRLAFDARTEPYRELVGWCDLLDADAVLVSLERAFEGYVTRLFRTAVGEDLRVQESIRLATVHLTPDVTVVCDDTPVSVWDAKWKRPEPTADDLHQVIAYAALLGVTHCGLVYPGRRFRLDTLRTHTSPVAVHLLRLPLTDDRVNRERVVGMVRTLGGSAGVNRPKASAGRGGTADD
jgi:hypothetical protein